MVDHLEVAVDLQVDLPPLARWLDLLDEIPGIDLWLDHWIGHFESVRPLGRLCQVLHRREVGRSRVAAIGETLPEVTVYW